MSLDFIAQNLEIASKDFQGQVGAVVEQAVGLRKRQALYGKLVIPFLAASIVIGFFDDTAGYGMLAVACFVWGIQELTKIRYEQVYSQIHGECVVYHLRCIALVSIVGALENHGIELPAIFTDVDELIADILKEDS